MVQPHILLLVRKPDICGIRPGWADTTWSMEHQSPGSLWSSLRIFRVSFLYDAMDGDVRNQIDMQHRQEFCPVIQEGVWK